LKKAVFVDTAYLVALSNASDRHHAEATALARTWSVEARGFVTTDAVLVEYANFFARSPLRGLAATTLGRLRAAQGWREPPRVRLTTGDRGQHHVTVPPARCAASWDALGNPG
jgi:predicted nucleic acid-binding protein